MEPLAAKVVADAAAVLGVHEDGDSNSGVYVDQYLKFVGLPPGNPWCCAFAVFRVHKAAGELGLSSRLPKTGSSSALSGGCSIRAATASALSDGRKHRPLARVASP